MNFWKYHVNGNDFLLVHQKSNISEKQGILLCDRHKGIGADGILIVRVHKFEVYYRHVNADGSHAAMCGNGIRCVGHWFMSRHKLDRCTVHIDERAYSLRMSDGNFVTLISDIPEILGRNRYNSGVVHLISSRYKARTDANVDVVEYRDPLHFHIRTIELGVGPTLSCGTGTMAAFYHGYRHGYLHRIAIGTSPGGDNLLRWGNNQIYMSAIVHPVFHGTWMETENDSFR